MSNALTHVPNVPVDTSPGPLSAAEKLRAAVRRALPQSGPSFNSKETALLLDRTGSMWGEPIVKLREAVRDFKGLRRFQYCDDIQELSEGQEVGHPQGNNNEPLAFRTLKSLGIKHVILVTDGHPDSPEHSLLEAKGLKIDIIYIGPPPPPKFLEDLAKATGGSYDGSVTFAQQDGSRQLEARIKGLLPAPEALVKGPIAL